MRRAIVGRTRATRTWSTAALLAACVWVYPVLAGPSSDASAESDVREVVERFRAAISSGDGETLRALFLPQGGAWLSMDHRADDTQVRLATPLMKPGSYEAFAKAIERSPGRHEEVFSDIDIHTDGTVASVDFDFVYVVDGKPVNRGLEAWQLAKTGDGWKIVSLIYSSHPPR